MTTIAQYLHDFHRDHLSTPANRRRTAHQFLAVANFMLNPDVRK